MSNWTRTVLQDELAHRYTSGAYRIDVPFSASQGAMVTLYTPDSAIPCGNLAAAKRAAKSHQRAHAAPDTAEPPKTRGGKPRVSKRPIGRPVAQGPRVAWTCWFHANPAAYERVGRAVLDGGVEITGKQHHGDSVRVWFRADPGAARAFATRAKARDLQYISPERHEQGPPTPAFASPDEEIAAAAMVPAAMVLEAVRGCLSFPFPQVCRHLVAYDLLNILERVGYAIPPGLADAVVRADDATAQDALGQWERELQGGAAAAQPQS